MLNQDTNLKHSGALNWFPLSLILEFFPFGTYHSQINTQIYLDAYTLSEKDRGPRDAFPSVPRSTSRPNWPKEKNSPIKRGCQCFE